MQNEDVANGLLQMNRSINRRRKITDGKNDNAERTSIQNVLIKSILAAQSAQLKKAGIISKWIFPGENGGPPVPSTISKHWQKYRTQFPERVTQYGLRHTFVSVMKSKMSESMLRMYVGHSENMDTIGVYGKEIDGEAEAASLMIDEIFSQILNS